MSTLIFGNIIYDTYNKEIDTEIKCNMVQYCKDAKCGIHFLDERLFESNGKNHMPFQLSDDFNMETCDLFFEQLIYTTDGKPLTDALLRDIDVLYGLLKVAFEFNVVKQIELRFSFGEVNEEEYDVIHIQLELLNQTLFHKYTNTIGIPIVKLIIENDIK